MDFETRPISELPVPGGRGARTGLRAAFAELPLGLALFNPAKPSSSVKTAQGNLSALRKKFPSRRIFTRADNEKHGIWIWWVEKEPDS